MVPETLKNAVIAFVLLLLIFVIAYIMPSGSSSLVHDSYIPRRAMIVENYPVRCILIGEWSDINRSGMIESIITTLNTVKHTEGSFDWNISIQLGQDIQSKALRDTNRKIIGEFTHGSK